jgi:hypothetical protein
VIEFTEWARDIISKAYAAARRLNPDANIRLARTGRGVQPLLAEHPEPGDREVTIGDITIYVEGDLNGLVDVEEPHDRIVLKPAGSPHNVRQPY